MNKAKGIGAFVVLIGALILKFGAVLSKMTIFLKWGAVVLALLHLSTLKDSTVVASRAHGAKPARQVAQNVTPNTNGAEKVVGPLAPVQATSPAITPSAPLGAGAIQAARNAAAAQNAQLSKETGQSVPTPKGANPAPQSAPAPTQHAAAPAQSGPVVQQGAPSGAATAATGTRTAANSIDAPVMRESFDYARDTRRDPFVSLMTTSDLRPTLSDLRLTGILYDLSGRRPVAILRDIAGGQWRVTTGMTLGRMRVAQIRPKTIIFTIEEFGFNRQDSLILGDTTRVRHR
jgi:hypothetical protein